MKDFFNEPAFYVILFALTPIGYLVVYSLILRKYKILYREGISVQGRIIDFGLVSIAGSRSQIYNSTFSLKIEYTFGGELHRGTCYIRIYGDEPLPKKGEVREFLYFNNRKSVLYSPVPYENDGYYIAKNGFPHLCIYVFLVIAIGVMVLIKYIQGRR